jgi:hypothetical protein
MVNEIDLEDPRPHILGYLWSELRFSIPEVPPFTTAVIFFWGSHSQYVAGYESVNPIHGNVTIDYVRNHGALANDLRHHADRPIVRVGGQVTGSSSKPRPIYLIDGETQSTQIWYLVYTAAAVGLGFGVGKFVGSILSELGKDVYLRIKRSIFKTLDASPARVIEICIEIDDNRYVSFFMPHHDYTRLEIDLNNAYRYLEENRHNLGAFQNESVDLDVLRIRYESKEPNDK